VHVSAKIVILSINSHQLKASEKQSKILNRINEVQLYSIRINAFKYDVTFATMGRVLTPKTPPVATSLVTCNFRQKIYFFVSKSQI